VRNPLIEESAEVYVRRREYLTLHLFYIVGLAAFAIFLWPARGFMYFFRTETIPASFQATIIIHVIAVTGINLAIGLDRLAESQIIRYSEWLERTAVPIRVLFTGKIVSALAHTFFLVMAGVPFAVVAAGPAGIPMRVVAASEAIILLAGLTGRVAGMLISHIGESRYVVRVIGSWVFVALFFVVTVRAYPPLNPIVAVIAQHSEDALPGANPLLASGIPLAIAVTTLVALYWISLGRHRKLAERMVHNDS